ncbi:DUF4116 domain-containing protein, partial [Endozoicomonas sp. ONNA2]|uniref:DUF4116 domain-containing protein n=1 Tax=Endozoicomonas sp. ONNA2 TaxID=2828741 RepID=UPI002148ADDD
ELILWLHKCFIARLWPVATASGQGELSKLLIAESGCFDIVDFSTSQDQPLFDNTCRNALRQLPALSATVLNLPDCTRLSIKLQAHACTIDLFEQADAGKQRTVRLCYSEPFANTTKKFLNGMLKRLWYLTQTLSHYRQNSGFNAPDIHFNEQTGQILFEFTHIPTKTDVRRLFVDMIELLKKLTNVDLYLVPFNLDESQTNWSMAAIRERLNNPAFSVTNKFALQHVHWLLAYTKNKSMMTRFIDDRELRHLVESALLFSKLAKSFTRKTNGNRIETLLSFQTEEHKQTLLWHWLLADPVRAEYLVKKNYNWLAHEATAMHLVSQNGYILELLAPEIRNQRAIVFAAIKSHPQVMAYAPETFKNDFEMVNYALANTTENPEKIIASIGVELSSDDVLFRRLLTTAVKNSSYALSCDAITEYLEQDPEFHKELLLLAIERNKDELYALTHHVVRKKLPGDHHLYRKLALTVLAKDNFGEQLQFFPDLNNDREVVLTAVGACPKALKYAGREFQDDEALVKTAVEYKGKMLKFASERLKDNQAIVLAAVKNYGPALEYASKRLRADPTIVTTALENKGWALRFADEQFKHNPHYIRLAVIHHHPEHSIDKYLDKSQFENKELLTLAVSKDPKSYKFVGPKLRGDEALAQLAVQGDGHLLHYVDSWLRDHEPTVRLAVQRHGKALMHVSPELRANKALVKLAVHNNGMALRFASDALKDCPEVVKLALQQNPLALEFAGDKCRNDPELVNIALQNNGNALRYVGRSLKGKPEIIEVAIDSIGPVAVRAFGNSVNLTRPLRWSSD